MLAKQRRANKAINENLKRKNSHVNKVIQEIKTTHIQSKVIGSLSAIENLMS